MERTTKLLHVMQNDINGLLTKEMDIFLLTVDDPEIIKILRYYFDQNGKRLRPMIFYMVSKALNSEENLAPFSLMLELIHTMSLYHDDVIDNADQRRGIPTVHERWDTATAIVGGDIFHGLIHNHILESIKNNRIFDEKRGLQFLSELITKVELPIGTAVLKELKLSNDVSIPTYDDAVSVAMGKTAPLFAFSASMAANLAHQNKDICELFYQMGMKLGLAFQLLDDVSDFFQSNKGMGNDLREDRKTPLLILCSHQNNDLLNKYRNQLNTLEEEKIKDFRKDFSDSFHTILNKIQVLLSQSLFDLEIIPQNQYKKGLTLMVQKLIQSCSDYSNKIPKSK